MAITLDGSNGMTAPVGALYNGLATATTQNSSSGTSVLFTGIPLWVKRITVFISGVSTNGTSGINVQLGSGSVKTTGYGAALGYIAGGNACDVATRTSGFPAGAGSASSVYYSQLTFVNMNANTWIGTGTFMSSATGSNPAYITGFVSLSGTLDRVNITTNNGTDVFDAGVVNIMWE